MFLLKLKLPTLALVVALGLIASALAAKQLSAPDPPDDARSTSAEIPFGLDPPGKAADAQPLPAGPDKLLVFRDGVYVLMDPDGKNEKKLGEKQVKFAYRGARLSPDGKWLAATVQDAPLAAGSGAIPTPKLYARAIEEKEPGTDLKVECQTFAWSPDGSEIACCNFIRPGPPVDVTHFTVNVKTREQKSFKMPEGHVLSDWSADGKFFLTTRFVADKQKPRDRTSQLYLVNRDGTEHKALTDGKQLSVSGRLSPDGKRVLHVILTPPPNGTAHPKLELAVIDIATGKSSAVGDAPTNAEILSYCWSPDGKRIAYVWRQVHEGKPKDVRDKETESHLVVCDPDGKNAKTVATEKGSNSWTITIRDVDWR